MNADENTMPPDWALLEAAKRSGRRADMYIPDLRDEYRSHRMFAALCDMIHRYEQERVDPDLIAARDMLCAMFPGDNHNINKGLWDSGTNIEIALAGIKRGRELERRA